MTKKEFELISKGDLIDFGHYYQSDDKRKEPIKWKVLEINDDRLLLISENLLDSAPYNETFNETTWDTCSINSWLNSDFLSNAFDSDEQKQIIEVNVSQEVENEVRKTSLNKVFLLSAKEIVKYFDSDIQRTCKASAYAQCCGVWTENENGSYWLRSTGSDKKRAAGVTEKGEIDVNGYYVCSKMNAVRPAMWIKI